MTENKNLRYVEVKEIPHKHILGRTGKVTSPLPLLFNGSGIEVVVTGSDLWIELETDCDYHEPWIAYEINGALMSRQMMLPGEHSLCLFRNMDPSSPKRVRFYRELQAMSEDDYCKVLVKGFKLDGEFREVPKFDKKLMFIGDSITSGEGTYGASEDGDWIAMYMSASVNYATMTAKRLNADYHLMSQGGWGVYCGWDNDIRHNIPSVYEKVCGLATGPNNEALGTQDEYDFSYQPDAIVVNLGTNDDSAFNQPPFTIPGTDKAYKQRLNPDGTYNREDLLKIKQATMDFLKVLRKRNPKAHIVWCYGMLGYGMTMILTEAITEYSNQFEDSNVGFLNLPTTRQGEFGAHMHPGIKSHEAASDVICNYFESVLGW